jgi:uncharacterized membrane protein
MEPNQLKLGELTCQLCGKSAPQLLPAAFVRAPIVEVIKKQHSDWKLEGYICQADLNRFRFEYIQDLLESEKGELTSLDQDVLESLKRQEILATNTDAEYEKDLTTGDRLSDRMADFGGSWTFIAIFGAVLLGWIVLNSIVLASKPFDPYPFILLNLILSCLAAIQAPVILMSQNRQEAKDRLRSQHDYQINLKAELEIRHLHEKLDHLLSRQWERLVAIQQVQLDVLSELSRIRDEGSNSQARI